MSRLVKDSRDGARFMVRVTPRASRTALTGVMGAGDEAAVKVALQAPPVEGKANAALVEFLAELLDVPRTTVEIAGGAQSRNKLIAVRGRPAAEIAAKLEEAMGRVKA
ncbi:DUF167 domain-containing protein [Paracidobacterium acidisoli]|uniref:DUF167 domain-containing protein n=1 Tax=Paracidobacterium acidisoli TaxID=2303751 RepID=UPI003314E4A9